MTNQTIIITGDWFVDEYWFVVKHQSTVSSHTGPTHYRIYSKRNQPVKDLCGAGLIARVMYDVREKNLTPQLIGIGKWHPRDLKLIAHFVHAKCKSDLDKNNQYGSVICNSYALMPETCHNSVKITLYNLLDPDKPYKDEKSTYSEDKSGTTIRVIRSYRFDGKKFKQLNRIDWEPDEQISLDKDKIREIINQINTTSSEFYVIIEDHDKGTVDGQLVDALKKLKDTKKWFIRTKNKNILFGKKPVPWLENFEEEIQLLALGPEISTRFYPVGALLTKDGNIALHAFEIIKALIKNKKVDQNEKIPKVQKFILTSDKLELIAVNKKDDNAEIYVWKPSRHIENIDLEKLNWTSAIFASLAYNITVDRATFPNPNFSLCF